MGELTPLHYILMGVVLGMVLSLLIATVSAYQAANPRWLRKLRKTEKQANEALMALKRAAQR